MQNVASSLFKKEGYKIKYSIELKNRKQVLACTTKYSYTFH